jgi:hypothetical protein
MASNDVDPLIRVAAMHTFAAGRSRQRAAAVRGDLVVAFSTGPNGLGSLVPDRTTAACAGRAMTSAA